MAVALLKFGLPALLASALLSSCAGPDTAAQPASPSPSLSGPAREALHPDPNFDYGFTIQVTSQGLHPHWLVAACCHPLTWRNLTGASVTIVFDHLAVSSGPIQPGGAFVYTPPHVESIAYRALGSSSMAGVVQVNQNFES